MEYFEQPYCKSRHSPRHCPVLIDAIASQLVRNGRYEAVDCKSSRLVSQEVSDLWRATTPDPVNIFATTPDPVNIFDKFKIINIHHVYFKVFSSNLS